MFKKQITCTALAMMFVCCIEAQSFGEIHGKVVDEKEVAIYMATVVAHNGADQIVTATDEQGKFRLKPLKPGEYTLRFFMTGYDSLVMKNVLVEPDRINRLTEMRLSEVSGLIEGIVIMDYEKPLLFAPGEHIETLTEEDLKHNASAPDGNIKRMVANMSSDIKVSPDGEELYFRGSRAGSVIYFVDGIKITSGSVKIPTSGIHTVSVYTGGVPAKYGDTTGGVIVVETKSYLQDYYKKLNQ